MGCTSAIVFTCFGAAYGTAKSGVGISAMGVLRPDLIVKSMFDWSAILVTRLTCVIRHCSGHYGWYHWYLRLGRVSVDFRWTEAEFTLVHRVHPAWSWSIRRPCRFSSRIRHWYCGRCWCKRYCTATKTLWVYQISELKRYMLTILQLSVWF